MVCCPLIVLYRLLRYARTYLQNLEYLLPVERARLTYFLAKQVWDLYFFFFLLIRKYVAVMHVFFFCFFFVLNYIIFHSLHVVIRRQPQPFCVEGWPKLSYTSTQIGPIILSIVQRCLPFQAASALQRLDRAV